MCLSPPPPRSSIIALLSCGARTHAHAEWSRTLGLRHVFRPTPLWLKTCHRNDPSPSYQSSASTGSPMSSTSLQRWPEARMVPPHKGTTIFAPEGWSRRSSESGRGCAKATMPHPSLVWRELRTHYPLSWSFRINRSVNQSTCLSMISTPVRSMISRLASIPCRSR
jgi:hypothetical protein